MPGEATQGMSRGRDACLIFCCFVPSSQLRFGTLDELRTVGELPLGQVSAEHPRGAGQTLINMPEVNLQIPILDLVIIITYMLGILAVGILSTRHQKFATQLTHLPKRHEHAG